MHRAGAMVIYRLIARDGRHLDPEGDGEVGRLEIEITGLRYRQDGIVAGVGAHELRCRASFRADTTIPRVGIEEDIHLTLADDVGLSP